MGWFALAEGWRLGDKIPSLTQSDTSTRKQLIELFVSTQSVACKIRGFRIRFWKSIGKFKVEWFEGWFFFVKVAIIYRSVDEIFCICVRIYFICFSFVFNVYFFFIIYNRFCLRIYFLYSAYMFVSALSPFFFSFTLD